MATFFSPNLLIFPLIFSFFFTDVPKLADKKQENQKKYSKIENFALTRKRKVVFGPNSSFLLSL
jgi:hypothetical protein